MIHKTKHCLSLKKEQSSKKGVKAEYRFRNISEPSDFSLDALGWEKAYYFSGTHPLGWAESDKDVTTVGTKVPIPEYFETRTFYAKA